MGGQDPRRRHRLASRCARSWSSRRRRGAAGSERLQLTAAADVLDRLFRRESGQAVAALARALGDLDRAEEAVQDAFAVALERWPRDGVPANPAGWIVTARAQPRDRPHPRRARSAAVPRRWRG